MHAQPSTVTINVQQSSNVVPFAVRTRPQQPQPHVSVDTGFVRNRLFERFARRGIILDAECRHLVARLDAEQIQVLEIVAMTAAGQHSAAIAAECIEVVAKAIARGVRAEGAAR